MLNHSVAQSECFSSLAEKMRCAMYPSPPGAAPGYQLAHQFTPTQTKNVTKGIHGELKLGIKERIEPAPPWCAARLAASTTASLANKLFIPPTARTP